MAEEKPALLVNVKSDLCGFLQKNAEESRLLLLCVVFRSSLDRRRPLHRI